MGCSQDRAFRAVDKLFEKVPILKTVMHVAAGGDVLRQSGVCNGGGRTDIGLHRGSDERQARGVLRRASKLRPQQSPSMRLAISR